MASDDGADSTGASGDYAGRAGKGMIDAHAVACGVGAQTYLAMPDALELRQVWPVSR